ncbi:sulfurtransferase TusA family protein [Candidatus Saganbacteria bacterium]|nr:sulfurtransferase TusA family protein [Candidatus Saganbacteria bacterium]
MFKLPKKVLIDAEKFKGSLAKFLAGELKEAFFKGIRVPWGSYSQRGGRLLMSRLRVPAGVLTPRQLGAIGEAAQKFGDGRLHITTRADIQIHNVPKENPVKIIEHLVPYNLTPRGGGGNTVRGITACYLSGLCPREKSEVYRLAWDLTEYFLSLDDSFNLPRKLKFAFSGCADDCSAVGVNDLGFIAQGDGFKVICGGGLGAKCAVGRVLQETIAPEEIGYTAKAVMNVFNKHGNRKDRHHNRLRFLIESLTWEKFVALFQEELARVKEEEYIELNTGDSLPVFPTLSGKLTAQNFDNSPERQNFFKYSVGEQKQAGYYYIKLRIPFGEITAEALIKLSQLAEVSSGIIFRATPRQNLIITNVPYDKVSIVHEKAQGILPDCLFAETILDVISCKAATTCNLGICNSIAMAPVVVEKLKAANLPLDDLKDVRIHINGCSNACGQHPIATLSFSGAAKKVHNRTAPFYRVWVGGKAAAEKTQLAAEVGLLPARAVPDFIQAFFVNRQQIPISELLKKFTRMPTYEEDRSYYVDFGKTEDFSMEGLGQGECGAGAIDMIESDLNSAKQSLAKARDKKFDLKEIKEALIYAARALLVVKGIDPRDEKEAATAFIEKFVKSGISAPEFADLETRLNDLSLEKITSDQAFAYAQKFYEEVKNIYDLMDSSFNFPAKVFYDLRGTPCPMNYVKAKIKLEGMEIGDIINIYLDEGEPIQNVPRSFENDGQEIIKIEKVADYFNVVVKKKV